MNDQNTLTRFPIILSNNCCLVINSFRSLNNLEDMWMDDYWKHHSEQKVAAKQLVDQISEDCSIRFLQTLRQAIANEIVSRNERNGTNHSLDLRSDD